MNFATKNAIEAARYALHLDGANDDQVNQLFACVGEVLKHYPTAKLTREKGEFFLQCENGFVLGNEQTAAETWFAAHASWTPCATLC